MKAAKLILTVLLLVSFTVHAESERFTLEADVELAQNNSNAITDTVTVFVSDREPTVRCTIVANDVPSGVSQTLKARANGRRRIFTISTSIANEENVYDLRTSSGSLIGKIFCGGLFGMIEPGAELARALDSSVGLRLADVSNTVEILLY